MLRGNEDVRDDVAVDIGEASFDAVVVPRQSLMVEAKQVQNGGVKIMHGDDIFYRSISEFIRGTIGERRLHSRSCQPGREAIRVVITTTGTRLKRGHATEFCTPDDKRVF